MKARLQTGNSMRAAAPVTKTAFWSTERKACNHCHFVTVTKQYDVTFLLRLRSRQLCADHRRHLLINLPQNFQSHGLVADQTDDGAVGTFFRELAVI